MRKIGFAVLAGFACTAWGGPFDMLQGQAPAVERKRSAAIVEPTAGSCEALPAADNTKLGIIRQMLMSGRPHAAIAYLDAAHIDAPQSDLLRADGLRQTGRHEQATELYRKLLGTCVAGNAYQGLGLIAGQVGDVEEAVDQLHSASALLPVDPDVRNDYGYALLMAKDYDDALHEFLTAIELSPGHHQAAHNLLLLLYRTGETDKAGKFAKDFGISDADIARLKAEALKPLPGIALNEAVRQEPMSSSATKAAAIGKEQLQ